MSSNQEQPNNNDDGEGGSNGHHQVPSWDEFNMLAHEEEEEEEDNGPDAAEEDGDEGSELLDADDDDDVEVNEPGHPEEFGPNLPPGFGGEDSQGENSQPAGNELLNDFSIPMVNYDLDDPEDPLQGSSSSFSQRPSMVGPQMPCANMLPRLGHNRTDEHLLPSIGSHTNQAPPGVPGPSVVDFIPADQPNQPSNGQQLAGSGHERVIGPALPPDLVPSTSSSGNGLSARHAEQARNAFPSMDELDDIGPAMPPDEPQQSSSNSASFHQQQPITKRRRSQERGHNIGPTLPSSSDEEEEEEDVEEADEELEANGEGNDEEVVGAEEELLARNGLAVDGGLGGVQQAEEDDDEILIGPMPPAPGRSEDEEQAEYLARLAQFEANKRAKSASNGLKREQWMTEPPKKMLKTGPLAAPKTSFSRSTAAPATAADIAAWTSVPNANGSQKNASTAGPSTSAAAAAAAAVPKRTEQDEWEEQRANELNSDRNESLMDIHQKKRNQDANAPSGSLLYTNSGERRPFNRDADMEVRGLGGGSDPKALKERMGELSNRFGHSKEKKFL